ncbi:histidine kinase, partial [Streptomyces sp. NRRL WC-3753]
AGIAIGNARMYAATRQRERWIDGSVAVTTALLAGSDVDDALAVVAEQARKLAESAAGIVLLPTDDGGLEIVAASADDPAGLVGTQMPPESPVAAQLLAGEPVFVEDSATDDRMVTDVAPRFGPSMM